MRDNTSGAESPNDRAESNSTEATILTDGGEWRCRARNQSNDTRCHNVAIEGSDLCHHHDGREDVERVDDDDDAAPLLADGGIPRDRGQETELTRFQIDLLAALRASEGSEYGLGLKRVLEERYNTEVNHGRLYPNLDDLVADGLVEKGELDKRTNEYSITADGRRALAARARWLTDADGPSDAAHRDRAMTDGGSPGSHLAAADDELVEAATASRDGDTEEAREAIRRARQRIQAAMTSDGGSES